MATRTIKRGDVRAFVEATRGRFVGVTFRKRTTGEVVSMGFTTNRQSYLVGGDPAYNAAERGLVVVVKPRKGFRSFGIENVIEFRFGGDTIVVED